MLETGLMEVLLADVRRQTGVLPLLEHALSELWRKRRGPWLTLDAYQQERRRQRCPGAARRGDPAAAQPDRSSKSPAASLSS